MLDFKIKRGLSTTLFSAPGVVNPKLIIELGCWYFCTDTAELFAGELDNENKLTLKLINNEHITDKHINSLIANYYKEHPELDPTVADWAKQPTKPTYTAEEVGAVNNKRKIANIDLDDDITSTELLKALNFQEIDPTVPEWAKAENPPPTTIRVFNEYPKTGTGGTPGTLHEIALVLAAEGEWLIQCKVAEENFFVWESIDFAPSPLIRDTTPELYKTPARHGQLGFVTESETTESYIYLPKNLRASMLSVPEGTITFTLVENSDGTLKLSYSEKTESSEEPSIPDNTGFATNRYILGTFNNWDPLSYEFRLKNEGDVTAYVTVDLEANTTYEFKVIREGKWTSNATAITDTVSGLTFSSSTAANATITTKAAGTYVFSFGMSNSQLSVTYPVEVTDSDKPPLLTKEYCLFGFINGSPYGCEHNYENSDEYIFKDNTLTDTFENDSYVAIKTVDNNIWYVADKSYSPDTKEITLHEASFASEICPWHKIDYLTKEFISSTLDESTFDSQIPTVKATKDYVDNQVMALADRIPTTAEELGALAISDVEHDYISSDIKPVSGKAIAKALTSINNTIGVVPPNKTVVEMITDAQNASSYDDTALSQRVTMNANIIADLTSEGDNSINKRIDNALNDFATKISNDGVVNTYKELVDYAAENGANITTLVDKVTTLETAVGTPNTEGLAKEVVNIAEDIKDLESSMQELSSSVIILKKDQTTDWESSDYILLSGEIGISYLENGNVIAKLGDGEHSWIDLPQIEGVFEDELTLTHNFGRYQTSNGFVKTTDAKGMTTSQWLVHALSETKDPEVTEPTFKLTATAGTDEIGSYITTLNWTATTGYGNYEYGPSTNLSSANRSWEITNNFDNQTIVIAKGTADTAVANASNNNTGSYTGKFSLTNGIQLIQESKKEYAKVYGTYELDATDAATPLNNIGIGAENKKISSQNGSLTAVVETTAYRKPFWDVLPAGSALDISALTSASIRGLNNSGTITKGLPSGIGKLSVPVGSQMVIFAAKAGIYDTLTATDDKAMSATVTFEKVAKAVKVEGANGFDAVDYDVWYVDWKAGIGSEKLLTLNWTYN